MRRALGAGPAAALLAIAIGVAPVAAASRGSVTIDVMTTFDDVPDSFAALGLADCATGTAENGSEKIIFSTGQGVFAGYKVFSCDGSDTGFVLRLNARFGSDGSVGTWSVVDAWGSLAGMHGAGPLIGTVIDEITIVDHYTGAVSFT